MRPPLWLQWVLSLTVAAVAIFALVHFVQRADSNQITTESPAGEVQQNEEAEALVAEDQAPHTVRLSGHIPPTAAVDRAIRADMTTQINQGSIDGPLQRSACALTGRPAKAGQRVSCTVSAAGVSYPFVAVVDARTHTIVYCKRDPPPVPSQNVPLSPRCTA
ncbi:MAG TPA: hypothetical protein VMF57_21200 [Solirubrobacteraceae bacterium]|nr:hypothetical protein [Solirubrobacteraceae bacterium]